MTVTSGDRPARFLVRLGHYGPPVFLVFVAWSITLDCGVHPPGALIVISAVAMIATILAQWGYHDRRLCERCIAAAPALNPDAAVARWDPALRVCHRPKRVVATLSVLLLAGLVASAALRGWPSGLLNGITITLIGAASTAQWQHTRLQPWCPYCHWGDGGDEETVPDPDPSATMTPGGVS